MRRILRTAALATLLATSLTTGPVLAQAKPAEAPAKAAAKKPAAKKSTAAKKPAAAKAAQGSAPGAAVAKKAAPRRGAGEKAESRATRNAPVNATKIVKPGKNQAQYPTPVPPRRVN